MLRQIARTAARAHAPAGAAAGPSRRRYVATAETVYTDAEKEAQALLAAVKTKMAEFVAARDSQEDGHDIEKARVFKELGPLAAEWDKYSSVRVQLAEVVPLLSDPDAETRDMFRAEYESLQDDLDGVIGSLPGLLLPRPETSDYPAVVSINAGVGGAEAALFAEELVRMYERYADQRGWKGEVMSVAEGPSGGFRELTIKFAASNKGYGGGWEDEGGARAAGPYGTYKWEAGVHRVQRVPATESMGRVHTSTVAVVVMPLYPENAATQLIDPKDVRTEVMRSRGAGGQHVNRTESAVRLTHEPTGISVSMQDSRSQHQNKAWAWDVLRARVAARAEDERREAFRNSRRSQVRGADRSEKVRTYNFPQDRMTDHRVGLSLPLARVLDGDALPDVHAALARDWDNQRLEAVLAGEGDLE